MSIVVLNNGENTYEERFVELMTYCFKMCKEEDFRKDWHRANKLQNKEIIMGTLDKEELASSITLTKRKIYIDTNEVVMYGLGGVATASTYRSGGICSRLIKEGLRKMYKEGAVFSMLAPFSYPFYEKLGWKWCYTSHSYEFEIERLKGFKNDGKIEKIQTKNFHEVDTYYHGVIKNINGMTTRDEYDWAKRIDTTNDCYTVIYKNHGGSMLGYMIYKIDNQQSTFNVSEMVYTHREALSSFYYYIYMHQAQVEKVSILAVGDSMVLDLLPNPRCETKELAYMMGRIIHVEKALMSYRYDKDGYFYIRVKDEILEENMGCFKVTIVNNRVLEVVKINEDEMWDMEIDIRELTQLIIGFRTLAELEVLGRLNIKNPEVRTYFKSVRSEVALYDFF